MDVRRALEVLGLSGPASRDGLRRAYLKAVRAHGPERDPRGFAEVRAAYELLQSLPWLAEACEFASEVDSPAPESARARLEQKPPPSWRASSRS